jgi:hypothetical protein
MPNSDNNIDDAVVPPDIRELLVYELASVLSDPDSAVAFVRLVGFPAAYLPAFKVPLVFWTQVVDGVANGILEGGIGLLVKRALNFYPENDTFKKCLSMYAALPKQRIAIGEPATSTITVRQERSDEPAEGHLVQFLTERIFDARCSRKTWRNTMSRIANDERAHLAKFRESEGSTTLVADRGRLLFHDPECEDLKAAWSRFRQGRIPYLSIPTRDEISIGRDSECHVQIAHGGASALHAIFANRRIIIDCGSTNGTRINGLRVVQCELHTGDVVQFGTQKFWYADMFEVASFCHSPPENAATLAVDMYRPSSEAARIKSAHDQVRHFVIRAAVSSIARRPIFSYLGHDATIVQLRSIRECVDAFDRIVLACQSSVRNLFTIALCGGIARGASDAATRQACEFLDRARLFARPNQAFGPEDEPRA